MVLFVAVMVVQNMLYDDSYRYSGEANGVKSWGRRIRPSGDSTQIK